MSFARGMGQSSVTISIEIECRVVVSQGAACQDKVDLFWHPTFNTFHTIYDITWGENYYNIFQNLCSF